MTHPAQPRVVTEAARAVLSRLADLGRADVERLTELTGLDQSKIVAVAQEGEREGWLELVTSEIDQLTPATGAAEQVREGLPERRALGILLEAGGGLPTGDFVARAKRDHIPVNEVFRWGVARGWVERDKQGVRLTEAGRRATDPQVHDADETALLAAGDAPVYLEDLEDAERVRTLLRNRPALAKLKRRSRRSLALTDAGRAVVAAGLEVLEERNVLTPEDLQSGAWTRFKLRPYDVTLASQSVRAAKAHPLRRILEQTRRAYLELGFTEVVSPMVESSFWNFDALFQPQDHPARDMQDTFYMDEPRTAELPSDAALVDRVRRTHEDGGDTGSEGWGYRWDPRRAIGTVLRTHTTAASIRALAAHPAPPLKVFCAGWVYRNETMSFKHLPVFHQVDGIVIDEEASLATLLGTLEAFYRKMGFQGIKFKPAFYPYTEPSVDVVVYMESRGKWLEMGGSGIFRPEVTEPLGCKHPVLAWGLGLERLAMIRYGLEDIRELFQGNLDAMREVPLCR